MKSLDHPNIVKCFDDYEDEVNHYIVMEYCEGGTLKEYLAENGRMSELEA